MWSDVPSVTSRWNYCNLPFFPITDRFSSNTVFLETRQESPLNPSKLWTPFGLSIPRYRIKWYNPCLSPYVRGRTWYFGGLVFTPRHRRVCNFDQIKVPHSRTDVVKTIREGVPTSRTHLRHGTTKDVIHQRKIKPPRSLITTPTTLPTSRTLKTDSQRDFTWLHLRDSEGYNNMTREHPSDNVINKTTLGPLRETVTGPTFQHLRHPLWVSTPREGIRERSGLSVRNRLPSGNVSVVYIGKVKYVRKSTYPWNVTIESKSVV